MSERKKLAHESTVDFIRRYRDEYAEQGNDESNCVDSTKRELP
jgi:hypothetical protein